MKIIKTECLNKFTRHYQLKTFGQTTLALNNIKSWKIFKIHLALLLGFYPLSLFWHFGIVFGN